MNFAIQYKYQKCANTFTKYKCFIYLSTKRSLTCKSPLVQIIIKSRLEWNMNFVFYYVDTNPVTYTIYVRSKPRLKNPINDDFSLANMYNVLPFFNKDSQPCDPTPCYVCASPSVPTRPFSALHRMVLTHPKECMVSSQYCQFSSSAPSRDKSERAREEREHLEC